MLLAPKGNLLGNLNILSQRIHNIKKYKIIIYNNNNNNNNNNDDDDDDDDDDNGRH